MKLIEKKIGKYTIQAKVFTDVKLAKMDEITRNALLQMRGLAENMIEERISLKKKT